MKVSIKDLSVAMEIKNTGVELEVRDTKNAHLGDLVVTKAHVIWCKGRTTRTNGTKVTWKKCIEHMEGI